ncbi:MAG: EAL domain-containing protein, partial [Acidimicrobiales bacterium]
YPRIDRTSVGGLSVDAEDHAIVHAVVSLAHALGLEVVGEGVETREQLLELQRLGCDAAQGYLLGRPSAAGPDGPARWSLPPGPGFGIAGI